MADLESKQTVEETSNEKPDGSLDAGSEPTDHFAVDWDGDDDPNNPLNWPSRKKAIIVVLISSLTFTTPLASSMFAPGVPAVMKTFDQNSQILGDFAVSVYLIGYAFGPLLAAPLCEIYGRAIVYQVTNFLYVAFTIGCAAAPTFGSLIGFRFLAGSAGAAPLVLGGGKAVLLLSIWHSGF